MINVAGELGEDIKVFEFKGPDGFAAFLKHQGAAGVTTVDGPVVNPCHYNRLKPTAVYTVVYTQGGLRSQLDKAVEYVDSSKKIVQENVSYI